MKFSLNRMKSPILIFLFTTLSAAFAQNDIYMKIQSEGFQPIPIAVAPFLSAQSSDISDKMREVLINDLNLSGFFRVVSQEMLASQSADPGNKSGRGPGISARVEGVVTFSGRIVMLSVKLYELPANSLIFNKKYSDEIDAYRYLAHRVNDDVCYYLVGEKGIASTKISFVTSRKEAKEISVVDYDGYGEKQMSHNRSLNLSPAWSPDGKYLAFTSYASGTPDLWLMSVKDGRVSNISRQKGMYTAPAWSPDGKRIAFTLIRNGNAEIYTMDTKGGNLNRLTDSPAIDSSPSWSPDGHQIAFTSDRSGNPQIYLMDAEGGNVRRLTFEGKYNDSAAWSPKGDLIAFVSREEGGFQVYTIDVTGNNLRRTTDGLGSYENPAWAPDGLHLAFASRHGGEWDIFTSYFDGSQLRQLTNDGNCVSPRWSHRLDQSD